MSEEPYFAAGPMLGLKLLLLTDFFFFWACGSITPLRQAKIIFSKFPVTNVST